MKFFNTGQPHYLAAVFDSHASAGENYYLSGGIVDEPADKLRSLES